jgi:hypothetical protein
MHLTPGEKLVTGFCPRNYVDITVGQIALKSCLVPEQG